MREQIEAKQTELAEVREELQQHIEQIAKLGRDIADRNRRLQVCAMFLRPAVVV